MELFDEISAWVQIVLTIGLMVMVYQASMEFSKIPGWRPIWIMLTIGVAGMLETRAFLALFAYGIEPPWMRWAARSLTPLQAQVGLFVGMFLFRRFLHHRRLLRHV